MSEKEALRMLKSIQKDCLMTSGVTRSLNSLIDDFEAAI